MCVCVLLLAGSGRPASRARCGAPHLSLWLSCPSSLFGPHLARVARALGVCFFFVLFFVLLSPFFPPPRGAPAVSGFLCFPAPGAPGLGALCFCSVLPPLPALFLFISGCVSPPSPSPWCFVLFHLVPWILPPPFPSPFPFFCCFSPVVFSPFCAPSSRIPCLGVSVVSGPGCPGPWRSVSGLLLLFFFSVFPLLFCPPAFLRSWRFWYSSPLVRLAGFLFPSPSAAVRVVRAPCAGAAVRFVPCWCCPVASFALAGAVCCCLWLRGGRCWAWSAVCCFPLACFGVGGPAWPSGSPHCCVLWVVVASCSPALCPVFCGSVLLCGSVLWCPAVRFALFCGQCGAVLLFGAVCVALCLFLGGVLCSRSVPLAVLCLVWLPACRVVSFALAGAVCCCLWLPAVRCGVSFPAVVFLWCMLSRLLLPGRVACGPAVCCGSLWCRVPLRCVPRSEVLCCLAVPCCGVLLSGICLCPSPVCAVPRCPACRVVRCLFSLHCHWCLALWCVTVCCGASLDVLWCGGAALVRRGVLLCCAVVCGAVSPCGAVLLCCAVRFALRFLKIKIK